MKKKKESSVYVLRGINGRERGGETGKKETHVLRQRALPEVDVHFTVLLWRDTADCAKALWVSRADVVVVRHMANAIDFFFWHRKRKR